jgi:hypothetical protein
MTAAPSACAAANSSPSKGKGLAGAIDGVAGDGVTQALPPGAELLAGAVEEMGGGDDAGVGRQHRAAPASVKESH